MAIKLKEGMKVTPFWQELFVVHKVLTRVYYNIHTSSATNQSSPHDKSEERKETCFFNICMYSNKYMSIYVYIINLASKQQFV